MKNYFLICSIILTILILLLVVHFLNKDKTSQLTLTYKSNGGVPCKWEYEIENPEIVEFVESYVAKDENTGSLVGAPIYTNYVFKGLKSGETIITFRYVNFTDGTVIEEDKNYIKVDNDKNISLITNNN